MRRYVKEETGLEPVRSWNVQGDDDRLVLTSYSGALAMWAAYTIAGFEINPKKFFIRTDSDEYLRQVGQDSQTKGYPARAAPSLVWRNPVSRELARGEERLREQATSWNQLFNRMGKPTWDIAARDMAGANGITKQQALSILESPAYCGGVGLDWEAERWTGINKAVVEYDWQYAQTPPLAKALAAGTPYTAEQVAGTWKGNVDTEGKRFEPFSLRYTERIEPVLNPKIIRGYRGAFPMAARADPLVTPTIAGLRQKIAVGERSRRDVLAWLDPGLYVQEEELWARGSRGVYWAWVDGKLPFKSPVDNGWSTLGTAHWHGQAASWFWDWCTLGRKITGRTVKAAALAAEGAGKRALAMQLFKIGG
jgi:hypothetical protein